MFHRPSKEDYPSYYDTYVSLVPDGDIQASLAQSLKSTVDFLSGLSEEKAMYRYSAGKWSLKEVLGHITDTERIMGYRLLRIARGGKTPLAGFDENDFIKGASFDSSTFSERMEDYTSVRQSTLCLLRGLSDEAWARRGVANGHEVSAAALAYIIAGHELHHLNIIKERYLA